MVISQVEQFLIDYLATSKATEPEQFLAFREMETEQQMLTLCRYLSDNPEATGQEILTQAQKIAKA